MSRHQLFTQGFLGRMLVTFMMGFACGLPLALTGDLLKNWLSRETIDLSTIGALSLIGLPYTLKFLWAPFFDRYQLSRMGRRRSWLVLVQILLLFSIASMGFFNPKDDLFLLVSIACLIAFFSASQDIIIDAYRREHLKTHELGIGSSMYTYGYRLGMIVAASGGIFLSDFLSHGTVYIICSTGILLSLLTTILSPEPEIEQYPPRTLKEAVIDPLKDYFQRHNALLILLFILLYKIGDTLASNVTQPFYVNLGYSNTEIGIAVKFFGFWATIIGAFLGGMIILKIGIYRSLWFFGFLQMFSTAGFAILSEIGYDVNALTAVIAFENLSAGMGTAAFIAFMASLTNKKFTATQYALLTSLMGVPRVILSAPTGLLADHIGWTSYFVFCTLLAIPGLWILRKFSNWSKENQAYEFVENKKIELS